MLYLAKFADDPLEEFPELEPNITEISFEENGFQKILDAIESLETADDFDAVCDIENFDQDNKALFLEFHRTNEPDITALHAATSQKFIHEQISYDLAADIHAMHLIAASKFLTKEFEFHLACDEPAKALTALSSHTQLAKKQLRSEGSLVQHLIAMAILECSLNDQYKFFSTTDLPIDHSLHNLQLNHDLQESFEMAMKLEWKISTSVIDDYLDPSMSTLSRAPYLRFLIYQPNKTRNTLGKMISLTNQIYAAPYTEKEALSDKLDALIPPSRMRITNNYVGEELLGMMTSVTSFSNYSHFYSPLLKNRSLHLLVALRNYSKANNGSLPNELSELVPEYIAKIPLDPFTDKPLLYSKEKKLIWSVGSDLKDNHGMSSETLEPDEVNALSSLKLEDEPHITIPF